MKKSKRKKKRSIIPRSKLGQFLFFFFEAFVCYFIVVANTRAFNQGNYLWTAVTDAFFGAQAWIISCLMVEDKNSRKKWAGIGSTLGGTCGSLFAIWCTKHLYGQ